MAEENIRQLFRSKETDKTLIDSNISHDEFVSVNNMLKENDDTKEDFQKF